MKLTTKCENVECKIQWKHCYKTKDNTYIIIACVDSWVLRKSKNNYDKIFLVYEYVELKNQDQSKFKLYLYGDSKEIKCCIELNAEEQMQAGNMIFAQKFL